MTLRVFKATHLIPSGDAGTRSPNAPLLHNPGLGEFHSWQDGLFWVRYKVKTVAQLYRGGMFKLFADFQSEYHIPGTAFFRYLQVPHTVAAQFGLSKVSFHIARFEQMLSQVDHSELTSTYDSYYNKISAPYMRF